MVRGLINEGQVVSSLHKDTCDYYGIRCFIVHVIIIIIIIFTTTTTTTTTTTANNESLQTIMQN